jgi:hypothetical protein
MAIYREKDFTGGLESGNYGRTIKEEKINFEMFFR